MRQKDDLEFSSILNRIRIGMPTKSDIEKLNERVIQKNDSLSKKENSATKYLEIKEEYPTIITLLPRTADADEFNLNITKRINIQAEHIKANDFLPNNMNFFNTNFHYNKPRKSKKNQKILKTADTAGLENELIVGVNSRVILKRNINVDIGLVNGALGTVTKLNYNKAKTFVNSIIIKFDNLNNDVQIERITADFEYQKKLYASRTQFPLSLAWALTIHKTQGLSLDAVMIDLGADIFEGGMAYVALSRARKLNNVFLIEFMPEQLYCNFNAIHEYNRLYEYFKMSEKKFDIFNVIPNYSTFKRKFEADLITNREYLAEAQYKKPKLIHSNNNERSNNDKSKITHHTKPSNKNPDQPKNKTNNPSNIDENPEINNRRYFLKLNNYSNSCFANSSIQGFLSLGQIFFDKVIYFNFNNFYGVFI